MKKKILSTARLGGHVVDKAGKPIVPAIDPTRPHHVSVDIKTGETTFTPLSDQEISAQAEHAKRHATELADAERAEREKADARLATLRSKAVDDPAFAALLEHLGVDLT